MKSIVFLSRDRVDNEIGDPDKVYAWGKKPTVDKNGNFSLSEKEEGEDVEFDSHFDVGDKLELLEWMIEVKIEPGTLVKLKIISEVSQPGISEVSRPGMIQDQARRLGNNPQEMRKFLESIAKKISS